MTLTYAGCRLSEALALAGVLIFGEPQEVTGWGLPKRSRSPGSLEALDMVHGIREQQTIEGVAAEPDDRLAGRARRHGGRAA